MAWRYSFGVKLSQKGKERLTLWLQARGFTVEGTGWDSLTLDTRLSAADLALLRVNQFSILLVEEPA